MAKLKQRLATEFAKACSSSYKLRHDKLRMDGRDFIYDADTDDVVLQKKWTWNGVEQSLLPQLTIPSAFLDAALLSMSHAVLHW